MAKIYTTCLSLKKGANDVMEGRDNRFEAIEKKLLYEDDILDLQKRFCKAHHVYCVCLSDYSDNSQMQVEGWEFVEKYLTPEVYEELIGRMEETQIEEVVEAELPVDFVRACGVVIRDGKQVLSNWMIAAVLKDKLATDTELPPNVRSITDGEFTIVLEFFCMLLQRYFLIRLESQKALEESRKSRISEKYMESELKRCEAITAVVRTLESEEDFTVAVEQIFTNAGVYLDIGSACLMQLNWEKETASIICEWTEDNVIPQYDYNQGRAMKEYPFMNGKPYVISATTKLTADFKEYFDDNGIREGIYLPLEANGTVVMYLCFQEYTCPREWDIEEIKFAHDVKRIIQSILTKRIAKNSLAASYSSLEEVLDNIGCGICVSGLEEDKVFFTNQKFRSLFRKIMLEGNLDRILESTKEDKSYHQIYVEEEDRWFDIYRTEIIWVDGKNAALYTIYDITDNKRYQQRIEKQANNDFLTGLYNRLRCEQDLKEFIKQAKKQEMEGALMYLDLDDFKHINDGLGHQYGDVLLKAISHSLQRIKGIENTCYRMGGDEFIIIVSCEKCKFLAEILEQICDIFAKPWFLKGADYYCTVSIGVVRFPSDGDSVQELIKKADLALYEAKKSGKNQYVFYGEGIDSSSVKRLDLEKNMRDATMNACNEFEVYYQPIIDVSRPGNPCTGAEALIRWNSEKLGFISPVDFIPLAEYLGLINPIGDYVLQEACKHCKYWNDMGHPEYKINVNLSVVQLLRNDMVDRVKEILKETRLNPRNLTLEVTENLAINDMSRMKMILRKIKELGVRVALDDFGTGYSSLNHIREMPIDVIKIDRCFISELGEEEYASVFVKMVCELAATIGMNVCVEGVEKEEQYLILKEMQIQMIQGFYFDKPMKLEAFEKKYL